MTLNLVSNEQIDTNDYELWLKEYEYTELDEHLRQDVLAICKFFCNEALVLQGLKKLAEQYLTFNKEEKKSLRQFFDDWGSKNHFNNPNPLNSTTEFKTSANFQYPKHTPILYGELTANLFNNVLLKNGYLSADVGAGPKHGKWAHTIQLFLIEEARKEGVLKLYTPTACQFIQTISQTKGKFESFSLWNLLFDSFDDHIFTNPNNITTALVHYHGNTEAEIFLASKLHAYEKKFDQVASTSGCYDGFAHTKYLSRLSEASSVSYKDKCGLLWFAPKNKISDSVSSQKVNVFVPDI
ncbi:helicase [Legionella gratiana]|uniref:Helicase n=1 Tax=Legionella gratiana TaxID=45066 RepID=A0A378JAB6_9GAMM|nr:LirA/MavJ family T4SS effector [Legionella gratiana]KTD11185.1 helicase [Legionella gratiana]STX44306.1 helicase [Legionella gratiana]